MLPQHDAPGTIVEKTTRREPSRPCRIDHDALGKSRRVSRRRPLQQSSCPLTITELTREPVEPLVDRLTRKPCSDLRVAVDSD